MTYGEEYVKERAHIWKEMTLFIAQPVIYWGMTIQNLSFLIWIMEIINRHLKGGMAVLSGIRLQWKHKEWEKGKLESQ